MLTTVAIEAFKSLAGPDYRWTGVGGCSRFDANRRLGSRREGARIFLRHYQDNTCPDCGQALSTEPLPFGDPEAVEFCHIVSRGLDARTSDEGKGWMYGNLFLGHRRCNRMQQARGPVVMPEHLSRPDLVPDATDWPSTPVLRSYALNA
jgi:hypothetical protein